MMTMIEDAYENWLTKAPRHLRQDSDITFMLRAAFYAGADAKRNQDREILDAQAKAATADNLTQAFDELRQAIEQLE